ncbi:DNA-directed RNA polymerase III subunit RPC7 [Sarotherodon galilaeus]
MEGRSDADRAANNDRGFPVAGGTGKQPGQDRGQDPELPPGSELLLAVSEVTRRVQKHRNHLKGSTLRSWSSQ